MFINQTCEMYCSVCEKQANILYVMAAFSGHRQQLKQRVPCFPAIIKTFSYKIKCIVWMALQKANARNQPVFIPNKPNEKRPLNVRFYSGNYICWCFGSINCDWVLQEWWSSLKCYRILFHPLFDSSSHVPGTARWSTLSNVHTNKHLAMFVVLTCFGQGFVSMTKSV